MPIAEPRRIARLDLAGVHVLCGSRRDDVPICNREFGAIAELRVPRPVLQGRRLLALDPPPRYEPGEGVALRVFRFPAGWVQRPDEVWDLHGEHRADAARNEYRDVETWWRRVTRLPRGLLHVLDADRPPEVPELPARAVCQRCRTISLLLPEELRVSSPLPVVSVSRA
jgi:hypothetical protein